VQSRTLEVICCPPRPASRVPPTHTHTHRMKRVRYEWSTATRGQDGPAGQPSQQTRLPKRPHLAQVSSHVSSGSVSTLARELLVALQQQQSPRWLVETWPPQHCGGKPLNVFRSHLTRAQRTGPHHGVIGPPVQANAAAVHHTLAALRRCRPLPRRLNTVD
jgi:hypothetical protein